MSKIALIIPAAGSGTRLNHAIPKPYVELAGKSILEHTIGRFLDQEGLAEIVVATSADYLERAGAILKQSVPDTVRYSVVEGGDERQDSIFNALEMVEAADLIMVHDAVRPFVTPTQIRAVCKAVGAADGAVLGVPAKDTIKKVDDDRLIRETPSRTYLWQAQTPQAFRKDVLTEAYSKAINDRFVGTDDASLVERLGYSVKMVEGDRTNFKITYPLDLKLAQLLLEDEQRND